MPLDLPKPIAEYFAADHTRDAQALARCFVDDGVVHDEGGTFRGTKAIRDWSAAARERYHHTVEPLSATERDGATIVAGRIAGIFPAVRSRSTTYSGSRATRSCRSRFGDAGVGSSVTSVPRRRRSCTRARRSLQYSPR
jgi:ketosteroid isomerase-like protein